MSMHEHPLIKAGRPDELEATLGLGPITASQIGAIIIFAANVEFRLERAIWRLQNHAPQGTRHLTDAKPVGELIDMFEAEGAKRTEEPERQLVERWCGAARVAFDMRHSIAHGAAYRFDTIMRIERNRSWQGEIRKRPHASIWGDEETFANIRLTFAVLLRVINAVSNDKRSLAEIASPERLRAVGGVRSLIREMASDYGPWFEKY